MCSSRKPCIKSKDVLKIIIKIKNTAQFKPEKSSLIVWPS